MTVYAIAPATLAHVEALEEHLRQADLDELLAGSGMGPGQALRESLAGSLEAWAGLADGEPICMFGLAPGALLGGSAVPWMLGTDALRRHAPALLRGCRPVVQRWSVDWALLWNHVDARNVRSVRWLRWLGFTIQPAAPYGVAGLPFHRFEMRGTPCATQP